jgi:predicted nucleotidyltransferase
MTVREATALASVMVAYLPEKTVTVLIDVLSKPEASAKFRITLLGLRALRPEIEREIEREIENANALKSKHGKDKRP